MLIAIFSLVLAASSLEGRTDTTLAVKPGTRLVVDCHAGEIVVRAWNRDAVRVEASHSRRVLVATERYPSMIQVRATGRHGVPARVEYSISVPAWMPLDLNGVSTEISVQGTRAEIRSQTVHGDVTVSGGGDFISLGSVDGEVNLSGARGRIQVNSVNQGVRVSRTVGDLLASVVNGDVVLEQVDAKSVNANTINGSVYFDGPFKAGGAYTLSSHQGEIVVGLPEGPDVTVSVATFSGDFSSSFPVVLTEKKGKRFIFTLGSGGARLELESFQGSIHLLRREEAARRLLESRQRHDDDGDHDANEDEDEKEERDDEDR
jgi:DUF4097 and DUF4098 domain-containing protein YvlB